MDLLIENGKLLNYYVRVMAERKVVSKTVLHELTYSELRKSSSLPSALLQSARDKALEAFKSYLSKKKKGLKVSVPVFSGGAPVRLDSRTFKIIRTDNKLEFFASVSTCSGRMFVPLLGQRHQYMYLRKLLNEELGMACVELVKRGNDFFFYVVVKREVTIKEPDANSVPVGVDLGLNNVSTSVIWKDKPLSVRFFSGRKSIAVRNHFNEFRKQLMRFKKLWRVKKSKYKEKCFMQDLNHKVSAVIVKQALQVKNPVIVLEDLKHIRNRLKSSKKLNGLLHSWTFSQLQLFIEYKAAWNGIPVVYVSPKFSSQRCNKCGFTSKSNRVGSVFKCKKCGYELNADLNAAINLAKTFSSSYMFGEAGNVAMPLTVAVKKRLPKNVSVVDHGSLRL
ncbi:transposase [Candidatus Micrarchaeota archaeon]|nr:transposase [Candidatus Micrarchaeota archaeon]